ncbi:D-alanine--D-alanine ligase [Candidatus Methylacidithermus pantelleriae]|uniref:D-alanine--D-alanine ligase n=1 Tax=Candidatus Methylacidithermus pantelleriae TaxID=2744239 RepID=A0A8J2FSA9_9BACT|nr:D-alanine--D-alanine ligase [Candidatus Methylacidithermus pantelleriae]CAF0694991.1 D-alanine--D-alanine ligase B [Candidatus Methylacidithermus pantelleriae]
MTIAVLKGGFSSEREISLRTGRAVAGALQSLGYPVVEIDLRSRSLDLPEGIDFCFVCLHGAFGEDGELQALLEARGLPFSGSGAEACRRAFDKIQARATFEASSLPVPKGEVLERGRFPALPVPVVIKPARQGSSVGVSIVFHPEELSAALDLAWSWDSAVLAEEYIAGRELTVAVLGEEPLPVVEIRPKQGFYDYRNKYTPGATEYLCPAPLPREKELEIQKLAVRAHKALGCQVYSRVDLKLDSDGFPWLLEVNTVPGMTETSLFPKAALAAGISFPELCERIVELSWKLRAKG